MVPPLIPSDSVEMSRGAFSLGFKDAGLEQVRPGFFFSRSVSNL